MKDQPEPSAQGDDMTGWSGELMVAVVVGLPHAARTDVATRVIPNDLAAGTDTSTGSEAASPVKRPTKGQRTKLPSSGDSLMPSSDPPQPGCGGPGAGSARPIQ